MNGFNGYCSFFLFNENKIRKTNDGNMRPKSKIKGATKTQQHANVNSTRLHHQFFKQLINKVLCLPTNTSTLRIAFLNTEKQHHIRIIPQLNGKNVIC